MKKHCLSSILGIVLCAVIFGCGVDSSGSKSLGNDIPTKSSTIQKEKEAESDQLSILFYGNSLTAGLGIDTEDGFVNLIQNTIDSLGKKYKCINAGLSGETTAGGKNRIDWVLKNNNPNIFVLELGGNDGLRGIDPKSSKENLQTIIEAVKANNSETKILLAGMEAPPNMGGEYTTAFRNIYSSLAKENNLNLIPFLLDKVGGIKEFNQADGIHPNEKGQVLVAKTIWKYLEPML